MNNKATTLSVPKPAATRGLGGTLDDFEAGLAQSFAEGSRLAWLLMQLLMMLRDALARFATSVPATMVVAVVAAVAPMDAFNVARPMLRARGGRGAAVRPAARGVVAADGVALAAVRMAAVVWASVRDWFCSEWVGDERISFSKSLCWSG
jgi:hypothetical protein